MVGTKRTKYLSLFQEIRIRLIDYDVIGSIYSYKSGYAYIPGIERPKLRNDNGNLDYEMFNWLECDAYVYNFPEKSGMASNGATYYEVLTSGINLTWRKHLIFKTKESKLIWSLPECIKIAKRPFMDFAGSI